MRTIEGKVVVLGAQGNPYYRTILYTRDMYNKIVV
jgi:hypothetical protein